MIFRSFLKEISFLIRKIDSAIPKSKSKGSHHCPRVRRDGLQGSELLWAETQLCWVAEASLSLCSLTGAKRSRDTWSQRLPGLLEATTS